MRINHANSGLIGNHAYVQPARNTDASSPLGMPVDPKSSAPIQQIKTVGATERGKQPFVEHFPARMVDPVFAPAGQKAMQTYQANQSLSRHDVNADYIGSVDVFA